MIEFPRKLSWQFNPKPAGPSSHLLFLQIIQLLSERSIHRETMQLNTFFYEVLENNEDVP